ncbi:MAG TPA: thioredoxin family protein [Roseiflexaceae bacterium]|nr:thioredoxin family protein [Roseiflexaceae bacterium]
MSLAIGTKAIPFDLPGVDGRQHSLGQYADKPVLVVVFTCNHCPYAQAWEGRLIQLQRDYADQGVAFVAINANDPVKYPGDNFEAMQERARTYEYPYPYLQDQPQTTARAYGAERTPEVFVFDSARQLVYHGAPDDNREADQVGQHYLRNAIDAALAGQPAAVAETPAVGCTIKWLN